MQYLFIRDTQIYYKGTKICIKYRFNAVLSCKM